MQAVYAGVGTFCLQYTCGGNCTSMIIMLIIFTSIKHRLPVVVWRRRIHEPVSPVVLNIKSVLFTYMDANVQLKETKSATMNVFRFFYFLFKSFVKVELSYVFTINLFTIAENCTEK